MPRRKNNKKVADMKFSCVYISPFFYLQAIKPIIKQTSRSLTVHFKYRGLNPTAGRYTILSNI